MPVGMSAVGGKADIVCQGLSGPFLARSGNHRPMRDRKEVESGDVRHDVIERNAFGQQLL